MVSSDFTLGGIHIPRGSDLAFSYVGARSDRFRDWSHISSVPMSEAAQLPQWERNTLTARLRHLVRNNEYVAALINTFAVHLGNSTLRAHSIDKNYNDAKERLWLGYSSNCEVTGLSLCEVEDISLDLETNFGWPTIPSIDEQKETDANIKKLEAGLTTYSALYAENNLFFDDEVKIRARDARLIQEAAAAEGISPNAIVTNFPATAVKPLEAAQADKPQI